MIGEGLGGEEEGATPWDQPMAYLALGRGVGVCACFSQQGLSREMEDVTDRGRMQYGVPR